MDLAMTIKVAKSIKAFIDNVAMSASTLTNSLQDLVMKAQPNYIGGISS